MINRYINNFPSWNTKRKLVVIESDDWGSIRMPSRRIYNYLIKAGLDLNYGDGLRYSMYDTLASSSDIELLFATLDSYKDFRNVSPIFTAICVVANPDFNKIRCSEFEKYFYEPMNLTLRRYTGSDDTFNLWHEGISRRIFIPQFHGREHLNISLWLKALRSKHKETLLAFNEGLWSFMPKENILNGLEYEASFQLTDISDIDLHKDIIRDGLSLFEKLFGYRAVYFVPPNGHINNKLHPVCFENGIRFRSSSRVQRESIGNGQIKRRLCWLGKKESNGLRYITRNCFFEPSDRKKDWIDICLWNMKKAFQKYQPAIISSHRVNYIGTHDIANRDNGLKSLNQLLKSIIKYWPDAEFISTEQLGALMENRPE